MSQNVVEVVEVVELRQWWDTALIYKLKILEFIEKQFQISSQSWNFRQAVFKVTFRYKKYPKIQFDWGLNDN